MIYEYMILIDIMYDVIVIELERQILPADCLYFWIVFGQEAGLDFKAEAGAYAWLDL